MLVNLKCHLTLILGVILLGYVHESTASDDSSCGDDHNLCAEANDSELTQPEIEASVPAEMAAEVDDLLPATAESNATTMDALDHQLIWVDSEDGAVRLGNYRVFIKYCVFP